MNHQDLSSVRPLSSRDGDALRTATLGNMNWCGERFSHEDVLADPAIAHYTVFEPERGDFGFIMVDPSSVVGVAWAQFLGTENPGYGFVSADVPEASLWVAPSAGVPGTGVGCSDGFSRRVPPAGTTASASPWRTATVRETFMSPKGSWRSPGESVTGSWCGRRGDTDRPPTGALQGVTSSDLGDRYGHWARCLHPAFQSAPSPGRLFLPPCDRNRHGNGTAR